MPGRFLKDNLKFDADHRFELRFSWPCPLSLPQVPLPQRFATYIERGDRAIRNAIIHIQPPITSPLPRIESSGTLGS